MRFARVALALAIACAGAPSRAQSSSAGQTVLFIGNSFTFGARSPVERYRAGTVEDLNGQGIGGVPALFLRFAEQMRLSYRVALETEGGKSLGFHYEQRRDTFDRAWDHVLLQEYSTLDPERPGDDQNYRRYAGKLAALFGRRNPAVDVRLVATWSRPDLVYGTGNPWAGQPIEIMAEDVHRAALRASAEDPHIRAVIPVGQAFNRAIATGLADRNPFDGIDAGRIDLWADDHYHASALGCYLEALVDFGSISGVDPRTLGPDELAARDLAIGPQHAALLQQIAAEALGLPELAPATPPH